MPQEEIILIASDSERQTGTIPSGGVARVYYDVLTERPYELTEHELHKEVARRRRRSDLQTDSYMLKRNKLVKHWGWGFHRDAQGRIGLVARESEAYARLSCSPGVKVTHGYRSRRSN